MASTTVTVYTREQCHLCTEAIETIHRVAESMPADIEINEIDVDTDPALEAEYGERVPYILIDDTPRFKFRVDERELRRYLAPEKT